MPSVIHFLDLEEMIPELDEDFPVRMAVQTSIIHTYADMPDVARFTNNIVLRQIHGVYGIYSWMLQLGEFDMANGKPMTEEDAEAYEKSTESIADLMDEIRERILATNEKMDIRPGLIDIGSAQPMKGTWSYLELEEIYVDGTSEQDGNDDGDSIGQVRSTEDDDDIPF